MKKKWLIPLVILVAVVGIWFVKTQNLLQKTQGIAPEVEEIHLDSVLEKKTPVILYFGSECCSTCEDVVTALNAVAKEVGDRGILQFVNTGIHPDTVKEYPITIAPSQVIFDGEGRPYQPGSEISEELEFQQHFSEETGEQDYTIHEGALSKEQMLAIFHDMGVK